MYASHGKIPIRIPTPNGSFLQVKMDPVSDDVPCSLGLDILDQEKHADNFHNVLCSYKFGWKIPIKRKYDHLYVTWETNEVIFTIPELIKLHRNFSHPSAGKSLKLKKRAKPDQADALAKRIIEEIVKNRDTCQALSAPPQRFTVSLSPSEIVFNREIALDLIWIESKAALHVVDLKTHSSSAAFINHHTVESVLDTFISCWASLYVGYSEKMRVDQGSAFTSVRWIKRCDAVGAEIQH